MGTQQLRSILAPTHRANLRRSVGARTIACYTFALPIQTLLFQLYALLAHPWWCLAGSLYYPFLPPPLLVSYRDICFTLRGWALSSIPLSPFSIAWCTQGQ